MRGGGRPGDEWREGLDLVMRRHVRTGFVAVTSREGDPLKKTGSGLSWSNFGGRTSRGINFSNPHSERQPVTPAALIARAEDREASTREFVRRN